MRARLIALALLLMLCLLAGNFFSTTHAREGSSRVLPNGFVYLSDIDPKILQNVRLFSPDNFTGGRVEGYLKPVIIADKAVAEALSKVRKEVEKDGYHLIVYDAYRPQKSTNYLVVWGNSEDEKSKDIYYPRISKNEIFGERYLDSESHSFGDAVDVTLIKKRKQLRSKPILKERELNDGFVVTYLDDGAVDMGTSYYFFDEASRQNSDLISSKEAKNRLYLKQKMSKHGFFNQGVWWHYQYRPKNKAAINYNFDIE